ncbi:hypothetical protein EC991_001063 [Linnemannia zychae]|nr:hypothetical protein EC991_001063 [Linnemannia zychae]
MPRRDWIVPIKEYLRLFAKLKELKIAGDWYGGVRTLEPTMQQWQHGQEQTQVEHNMPWKLQILVIDRHDMSFFPYCPNLEHFTYTSRAYEYGHGVFGRCPCKQRISEQLQSMSRLHTVVIISAFDIDEREFKVRAASEGDETGRLWELTSLDSGSRRWTLGEILDLM